MNKHILLLTILFSVFIMKSAAASKDSVLQLTSDKSTVDVGQTVNCSLKIGNASSVAGVQCIVFYDKATFSLEAVEKCTVMQNAVLGSVNSDAAGKIKLILLLEKNITSGENIINFTLKVKDGASASEKEIYVDNIILTDEEQQATEHEKVSLTVKINAAVQNAEASLKTPSASDENPHSSFSVGKADTTVNIKGTPPVRNNTQKTFDDISEHWAKKDIEYLCSVNIINGVTDTCFAPQRSVTRAEFVKMISRLLNLSEEGDAAFSDVNSDAWYSLDVRRVCAAKLVEGSNGKFRPNELLTRAEASVITKRIMSYSNIIAADERQIRFSDASLIPMWAVDSVKAVSSAEIMIGDSNNCFRPNECITRAESAALIKRICDVIKK